MAQNKKTEAEQEEDLASLPELTDKQSKFVTAILAGKSGADAIRESTDTSNWSQQSIWTEATKLRNNPSVRLWLRAARKSNMGAKTLTLDNHLRELERLKEIAVETGNVGAAVKAEESRGKAAGLYVEKHQDVTDHDPTRTLKEIAQHNPELASSLAKQHNIPWGETDNTEAQTRH